MEFADIFLPGKAPITKKYDDPWMSELIPSLVIVIESVIYLNLKILHLSDN